MKERLQQLIDTNEFEFLKTMSEEDIWKFAFAIFYVFSEHEEQTGYQRAIYQSNDIKDINVDYIILNAIFTNREDFISILNNYLNNIEDDKEHYRGFIDRKTVYKVADYE